MFVAAVLLSGCATTDFPVARERAALQDHSGTPTATMKRAAYDRESGTCTTGSLQLLSGTEYQVLVDGWKEAGDGALCVGPDKAGLPSYAGYPDTFRDRGISGAAHVLVRLERDGSVESVHAVCATDDAFAEAAEATASSIEYVPMTCDGIPKRSAFLLPFAYDN